MTLKNGNSLLGSEFIPIKNYIFLKFIDKVIFFVIFVTYNK